jgi:uncharacterized membrane protein YhaH (DUF805 family)
MRTLRFLFGFNGRLARGRFWIYGLAIYAFATVAVANDPVLRSTAEAFILVPGAEALVIYLLLGMMSFAAMVLAVGINAVTLDAVGGPLSLPALATSSLLAVVLAWTVTAVGVRRLHDRGKRGAWLVLFYLAPLLFGMAGVAMASAVASWVFVAAALIIHAWSFVELGLRRGTHGANRFGPDPRA